MIGDILYKDEDMVLSEGDCEKILVITINDGQTLKLSIGKDQVFNISSGDILLDADDGFVDTNNPEDYGR